MQIGSSFNIPSNYHKCDLEKLIKIVNKFDSSREFKQFDTAQPSPASLERVVSKSQSVMQNLLVQGNNKAAAKMHVKLNNFLFPKAHIGKIQINIFEQKSENVPETNPLFKGDWSNKKELENLLKKYDINLCKDAGTAIHIMLANEQFHKAFNLMHCTLDTLNPNLTDAEGKTILILAAKVLAPAVFVKYFLIKHPDLDINARDSNGATALHYASLYGNLSVVNLLIENGADLNIKDNSGLTPLDWVKSKTQEDLMNCLRSISLEPLRDSKAKRNYLTYESVINTKENFDAMAMNVKREKLKEKPKYSGVSLVQELMNKQPEVIEFLENRAQGR